MQLSVLSVAILCAVNSAHGQKTFNDTSILQGVEITAVKAAEKNPFAKTNLTKAEIKEKNIGQDLPFILNNTPSVVVNSDAGNGIGYTGIRIRGTDATRINVTLNGIPYNDAESLGTFFVDLPDIASSAGSIQVQRGVGTSSNGAGSFGGSINVSTNEVNLKPNIELNSTAGSYETFKNTLIYNSGIFKKYFTVDARMSNIRSQGYIDRASVRLRSYYLSTAYMGERNSMRLNVFTGKERTYQAWYGVNEAARDSNRTYNSAGTERPGVPYENETDNYTQTHYQLFFNQKISKYLKGGIALFLTPGKGYYEQYKAAQFLSDYSVPGFTNASETDLIRRLWLDNKFYGTIYSLQFDKKNTQVIFGGGYNRYEGKHFGEIISAKDQPSVPANFRWYENNARKNDLSAYLKWTENVTPRLQTFVDLQMRRINYDIYGFRNNPALIIQKEYSFFNPKAGITYTRGFYKSYISYGRAVKEPNRADFEASLIQQPKPETLNDFETGIEYNKNKIKAGANIFYMVYKNQLVQTGKINDVGSYTRTNVPESYRAGIEFFGNTAINKKISLSGNLTLSKNKVSNFTEYYDDYDNGGQLPKFYSESDLSFSPEVIGSLSVNIIPLKNMLLSFTGKYVGNQFLDNSSDNSRKLQDFYTQDARVAYTIQGKKLPEINLFLQGNNILSKKYEPNGYTFSYISGGILNTENFYYPMAPANFIFGINMKF